MAYVNTQQTSVPVSLPSSNAEAVTPAQAIVSLNHLLLERATSSPNTPVIGIPNPNIQDFSSSSFYTVHTYASVYLRAARLARWLVNNDLVPARKASNGPKDVVVALFAISGWEYIVLEMAISRLGWCCVFLSTNNSVAALVSLLQGTNTTHLFYDRHSSILRNAAYDSISEINAGISIMPTPDPAVAYEDPSVSLAEADVSRFRSALFATAEEGPDDVFCVHSSGSTGFPKPIWLSHRVTLANIMNNFNLRGFVTLPLFHGHGNSALYRAIYSRKPIFLYPTPPLPLTSAALVAALNTSKADLFYAVPYVLKLLSETAEGIAALRRLKLVSFGGSACPDEVGDKLVREGVRLVGHYGTTEVGQLMTSFRDFDIDKDWCWVRSSGARSGSAWFSDYLLWEPADDDTYELVVKKGWPAQTTFNRSDGGYATKDLFIFHPTNPCAFKYVGRLDDTLVHANGEKTAPVPIELALRESPLIDDAIIFGAGRMQAGALIMLSDSGMGDWKAGNWSIKDEEQTRKAIWSAVESANKRAPTHSRLLPEMVRILPSGSQFPRADKGSIIRAKVYSLYSNLIEETYSSFENGSSKDTAEKIQPASLDAMQELVAEVVASTVGAGDKTSEELGLELHDDFAATVGLNSLQAARVRNVLQRDVNLGGAKLSSNVVFENPTIFKLAQYLFALAKGHTNELETLAEDVMLSMVEKYSSSLEPNIRSSTMPKERPTARVVVLTGATGSLGAHLLDRLLQNPEIGLVYCLCRARDNTEAQARVEDSLRQRRVATLDERTNRIDIHCLAAKVEEDYLGLDTKVYDDMVDKATDVIHNAWPVNFNMAIESFETQIAGARNLLKLCILHGNRREEDPATFYFSSSISAVVNTNASLVPEDFSDIPNDAQNIGYARSKWIVEQICKRAAISRGVRTQVLRIGQMVGDSNMGVWQTTEAFPLMFRSAQTVGVLPELHENVSWLPVDVAARAIIELVTGGQPVTDAVGHSQAAVYHVLNPHVVSWSSILDGLYAAGLTFERVPPSEWLARLREADESTPEAISSHPVLKLRAFFEDRYGDSVKPPRPSFETKRTTKLAPSLAKASGIDRPIIAKFVQSWEDIGFLE